MVTIPFENSQAQDHSGVAQLGYIRTKWDYCYDVAIQDTLAYVATGLSGIQIINISDLEEPRFVGYWQDNDHTFAHVTVDNNHVYAGLGQHGMVIIDVSNPQQPNLICHWGAQSFVYEVKIQDNLAYLASYRDGLRILDISDPNDPEEITTFDTPGETRSLFIDNNIAYLADGRSGLQIVDVQDPNRLELLSTCETGGSVDRVCARDNLVYLVSDGTNMLIVDVTEPEAPEVISRFEQNYIVYDLVVRDTLVYMNHSSTLRKLDISDPRDPTLTGFIQTDRYVDMVRGFALSDSVFCLAGGYGGLYTHDPYHWRNSYCHGSFNSKRSVDNLVISDSILYASKNSDGIMIMDISLPERSRIINFYRSISKDLKVEGGIAIFTSSYSFKAADLTNPMEPELIANHRGAGHARGICIDDAFAYTSALDGALIIYNIENPREIYETGRVNIGGYHHDVVINGEFTFIATGNRGLQVVDISDRTNPIWIECVRIEGINSGRGLFIEDSLLFYAASEIGLIVFDITNQIEPIEIARFDPEEYIWDVVVKDNYAYLATGRNGLLVININDLNNMHVTGYYDTPGEAKGLFLDENSNLIYVADEIGIGIYDPTQALQIATSDYKQIPPTIPMFSVFPNPANARFDFLFETPSLSGAVLSIYDLNGRLIHQAFPSAGANIIEWNALNASNGIYLARIENAYGSSTVRIIQQK